MVLVHLCVLYKDYMLISSSCVCETSSFLHSAIAVTKGFCALYSCDRAGEDSIHSG